jgi:hypothetical protein
MFEFIKSFLVAPSPISPPGPMVTVLIIPADGAPPRIERVATVNVRNDGKGDHFLHYVPDMRAYWVTDFGWSCRDIARIDITDHVVPALNRFYYSFKSFDVDDLPMSKHGRWIYGDACIVKTAPERYYAHGFRIIKWKGKDIDDLHNKLARFAVYDDITTDVVDTGLWKDLVLKLSEV